MMNNDIERLCEAVQRADAIIIGVEAAGWHAAAARYAAYCRDHERGRVLYLEIGVGWNTPVFCSMRTKRKSTRNTIKRQISEGSHTWINGFERRCA